MLSIYYQCFELGVAAEKRMVALQWGTEWGRLWFYAHSPYINSGPIPGSGQRSVSPKPLNRSAYICCKIKLLWLSSAPFLCAWSLLDVSLFVKLSWLAPRFTNNVSELHWILCCSYTWRGTRWRSWLRHYAANRKVAGSIPDGVFGIFLWHNPSGGTMALGLNQLLTEMCTRNNLHCYTVHVVSISSLLFQVMHFSTL